MQYALVDYILDFDSGHQAFGQWRGSIMGKKERCYDLVRAVGPGD